MASIRILKQNIITTLDNFDEIVEVTNENYKAFILGIFRENKLTITNKLNHVISQGASSEEIKNFFLSVSGEYCLVFKSSDSIRVALSFSCPQYYLSRFSSEDLFLTQKESELKKSKFNKDNLFLRYMNSSAFFINEGIFSDSIDYVLPGMEFKYKHNFYDMSWIIPIEKFSSRDDHESLAKELANTFSEEMKTFKNLDQPIQLELSQGIDSALILSAAVSAGLNIKPTTFKLSHRLYESQGAEKLTQYFKLDLEKIFIGPPEDGARFSEETDLGDYLHKMEPLLKFGTGSSVLQNISLLSAYKYGPINTIEGSVYPRPLCIKHYTSYPSRRFLHKYQFQPKLNSEKRYLFSIKYAEDKINSAYVDNWGIGKKFSTINPYYWEFFEMCFTGRSHDEENEIGSEIGKIFPESLEIQRDLYKKRGFKIIEKILKSKYLKKSLEIPSPEIANKLLKLVIFINNVASGASRLQNYRSAKVLNQFRPGLSSSVLMKLLEVKIDEKIVNYPKWHIFRAFEILSGKNFFEINKPLLGFNLSTTSLKDGLVAISDIIMSSNKSINDISLNNRSLISYLKQKKIFEKHDSLLKEYSLQKLIPDHKFINKRNVRSISRFEFLKNVMNLSMLCDE